MRNLFAPEVVQSSALDCGPAALKSLLGGFGIPVSYGRLREACQTGLDGSSIDTLESVANLLGLESEQVMLPAEHVTLASAKALPAIAVTTTASGLTHFVVIWRRHGPWLQVMDPGVGRRWVRISAFDRELYRHSTVVPDSAWREFAGTPEFQGALETRLRALGLGATEITNLRNEANSDESWRSLATLEAAIRALEALGHRKKPALGLRSLLKHSASIPEQFWSVLEAGDGEVVFRGAILLRAIRRCPTTGNLPPELASIATEDSRGPLRQLWSLLSSADRLASFFLLATVPLAALGVMVETFLFRTLFDIAGQLHLAGQRIGAMIAVVSFSVILLFFDLGTFLQGVRVARHLELALRIAFLRKIPALGDRYFQSRLLSDLGERHHVVYRLRNLPDLVRRALATSTELAATCACMIWIEPVTAPFVLVAALSALVPFFFSRAFLTEGDLRVRTHNGGLTRYFLDAVLGFSSIRAHGAEENMRRSHGFVLREWITSSLRLQRMVVAMEVLQTTAMYSAIAAMFVQHPVGGTGAGKLLLVAYWALNIPALGQALSAVARQYPMYRNVALRFLEPLGAPAEKAVNGTVGSERAKSAPAIEFHNVSAEACGHPILSEIDLKTEAGSHVAIVGRSGAGKSSLIAMLLGWLPLKTGQITVNGSDLDATEMRTSSAWLDPAAQLWNRSLYANLSYGSSADASQVGRAAEAAHLRTVLLDLPGGMQEKLGESGGRLSGGEGQRVRLGRAILSDSPTVVLLDEPFRGLDRDLRSLMLREARERWRGCTLLCVTHDLSETRDFDQVIVMENGRVAEQGSPTELRNRPGSKYRELLRVEREVRAWLWNRTPWRRLSIERGVVTETLQPCFETLAPESEVA